MEPQVPFQPKQRIAYDHYVGEAWSDAPRLVPCLGRGDLWVELGDLPGVGLCWLVDDDETMEDLPVPVSHMWLDDHPSVSRYAWPTTKFLTEQLVGDVERALREPIVHSAFDIGLCLMNLQSEIFDLKPWDAAHEAVWEITDVSERSISLNAAATFFDPNFRDESGVMKRILGAMHGRVDLEAGVVELESMKGEGGRRHVGSASLATLLERDRPPE